MDRRNAQNRRLRRDQRLRRAMEIASIFMLFNFSMFESCGSSLSIGGRLSRVPCRMGLDSGVMVSCLNLEIEGEEQLLLVSSPLHDER